VQISVQRPESLGQNAYCKLKVGGDSNGAKKIEE